MRLRTKFVIVLLVAMAVLSGVVAWSVEDFRQATLEEERASTRQAAGLAADQLDTRLRDRVDRVRFYAARPGVADFDRSGESIGSFVNGSRFYAARIVAPNGTVVDARGAITDERRRALVGRNDSNRTAVRRALAGETYVAPPERRPDGGLVVRVSAPIGLDPANDTVAGAFVAAFRLGSTRLFGAVGPLETDGRGVAITGRLADGSRATLYSSNRSYPEALTATARLETVDWTVRVVRDRSRLSRRLAELRLVGGAVILLIVGTVSAVGVWEYRTNLRQTERLLSGFEALSAGDYDHELSLAAAEEWERIAEGFNDLSTGLRERERAVRDREQRLSVLNRVLRHNLQNDLTVVRGHAEIVSEADSDQQVRRSVEQILATIDELMGHSRTARKIEDAMDVASEGLVVVDAAETARRVVETADTGDATVRVDAPDSAPAWGIAALESAVESLLENAVEHAGEAPVVEVSVAVTGAGADETVRVTVADDGPGIPDHEREVLGRVEETALEHGSGLGLWLAHWVAEKSGGDLVFGDQSDGGRATVVLASAAVDREVVRDRLPVPLE